MPKKPDIGHIAHRHNENEPDRTTNKARFFAGHPDEELQKAAVGVD